MKIVFCCTGNTCRSPMAEQLMRQKLQTLKIENIQVQSCGVMCHTGDTMNDNAKLALERLGVKPMAHVSKAISHWLIDESDMIICMTKNHKDYLTSLIGANQKIKDINQLVGMGDVGDPFGGCLESYILCANVISQMLDKLIPIILEYDKNNQN